jgi:DNA-binding CsgD family transcriptional regulator
MFETTIACGKLAVEQYMLYNMYMLENKRDIMAHALHDVECLDDLMEPLNDSAYAEREAQVNAVFQFEQSSFLESDIEELNYSRPQLSLRESTCLELADSMSDSQIAEHLGIKIGTVKGYLRSGRYKLQAETTSEAVAKAALIGLLEKRA